jgi:Cellulase (glycosyl hydrolase family 5)
MKNFLLGVNFHGFKCASYQNGAKTLRPPNEYINDSFKIFAEAGIRCIRFPLYWESYEKNSEEFIQELDVISSVADKYDVLCVYDNHQWKCSSCLGYGIGFPNSLLIQAFEKDPSIENSLSPPTRRDLEKFWNGWWDRKLETDKGKDSWDAQLEFLEVVIKRVKDKKSTVGFEILNEPQVFRQGDFKKVGNYHDYIVKKISMITDKILFFCFTSSASLYAINFPWEQAKTKPSFNVGNNIIFDVHPYPPYVLTMEYYKVLSSLMKNISIYVGEFNAGIKKGVEINAIQFKKYIKRLKDFKVSGAAFWEWSYVIDNDHPAFNLTNVIDDKIYSNTNFDNFTNVIKEDHN